MDSWLTGPVVITGAEGHVGRHVRARLADLPNEVRPLDRGDDLTDAFRDADVALLLAGSMRPPEGESYEEANVEPVRAALAAARDSSIRRIVLLSYVGADPAADNEYLRAKGRAEWSVLRGGNDVVVLRSTYIFGPRDDPGQAVEEMTAEREGPLHVPGTGDQRVQPVFVGDVAAALVRAGLDPAVRRGTYELGGPDEVSLEEFLTKLNGGPIRERHLHPFFAYAASHFVHGLTPALVGVLLRDSVARPPLAVSAVGLATLTPLDAVWAVAAAAA